jgi:Do/DeqQ family serine protease
MKHAFQQCIIFIFMNLICTASYAAIPLDNSLAPMLQGVLPAVVNIKAKIKVTDFNTLRELQKQQQHARKPEGNEQAIPNTFISIGSGVLVDAANGYIITNAHVINDAQSVAVTLSDGRHFTAKIIGADKPSDIAVLQIKAKNLTALLLADSNKIKVGDVVAAVGNPFGLNQTVTSGIVSALGRTTLGIESYENFIQTDAPINPGNSGGALIDMHGQLIGINTAILAPDRGSIGIGFAIPTNMVKSVMQQLLEYGNVKRGVLGIGAQDLTPELASAFNITEANGAAVTLVLPNSPAAQAGLQVGDIITAVNGSNVKNASDVVNTIGFLRVDSKVNVNVMRQNKHITVNVALSDPSKRKQLEEKIDPYLYGVALKHFTLSSPVHGSVEGVLVVGVDEETNAWNSDLRPGDIITSANQQKISSIPELKAIASKAKNTLLLNVLRGNSAIFLVINTQQEIL